MSNLAAVMPELGRIEVQEVPLPEPGPREVRVRVRAVGVCGSDTAYYRIGRIGDWIVDGPIILGHEAAGEVVAVGEAVTRVQVGDRVAIEPGTPCRDCADCHAGDYHLCPDLRFLATPPYDGALIQNLVIDERNLFGIPDSMSMEAAAMCEPLSVGIWAAHRTGLKAGDRSAWSVRVRSGSSRRRSRGRWARATSSSLTSPSTASASPSASDCAPSTRGRSNPAPVTRTATCCWSARVRRACWRRACGGWPTAVERRWSPS